MGVFGDVNITIWINCIKGEITMLKDHVLPIGSIVRLEAMPESRFMICGTLAMDDEEKKFDYNAVSYPIGLMLSREMVLFNHDKISEVLFEGYKGKNYDMYLDLLERAETGFADTQKEEKAASVQLE